MPHVEQWDQMLHTASVPGLNVSQRTVHNNSTNTLVMINNSTHKHPYHDQQLNTQTPLSWSTTQHTNTLIMINNSTHKHPCHDINFDNQCSTHTNESQAWTECIVIHQQNQIDTKCIKSNQSFSRGIMHSMHSYKNQLQILIVITVQITALTCKQSFQPPNKEITLQLSISCGALHSRT